MTQGAMDQKPSPPPVPMGFVWRMARFVRACFHNVTLWAASVVILCALVIAFLIQSVVLDLEQHRSAVEDRVLWNISQSEVEMTTLQLAIANSMKTPDAARLTQLRRAFDIFYARVSTVEEGTGFADLRKDPQFALGLAQARKYVATAVRLIDSPNEDLIASLPALEIMTEEVRRYVRQMSLDTVRNRTVFADGIRAQLVTTLLRLGGFAVLLIAALLLSTLFVLRLSRSADQRAQRIGETNSRIEEILSRTNRAVITVDNQGAVLDFNLAAEGMFGLPRGEVLGRALGQVPLDPGIKRAIGRLLSGSPDPDETGEALAESLKYATRADGSQFPVEVSMSVIESPAGRSVLVWVTDITPRLRREQQLNEALERAVAGETAKARMLNVMSHEVRTPLNGLIGALQVLDDTILTARQRKIVGTMNTSSEILLNHVNSVLEISQIDAGNLSSAHEPFDLKEVAQQVVENQIHAARSRENVLVIDDMSGMTMQFLGDAKRIRQILINLVSNANKFTQAGEIRIRLRTGEVGDEAGLARIEVCDTGMGIAEENLERIFEDFVTIDTSYERRTEGTGLGLGLCRRLAAMMDGTLTVESEIGQGSVFRLTLPLVPLGPESASLGAVPSPEGPAAPQVLPRSLKVLLAEDNPINMEILSDMLTSDGHRVYCARDGQEAVERAQARAFDVILMDISMPRQNGVEATKLIREGDGPCKQVPILAVTAHAQQSEIDKFLRAGMTATIVKPVSRARLRQALASPDILSVPGPKDRGALVDRDTLTDLIDALGPERVTRLVTEVDAAVARFADALAGRATERAVADGLSEEAHKLAGAVALVGAAAVREHLVALEHLLAGADGGEAELHAHDPALVATWQATKAAITETLGQADQLRAMRA
ncbi:PAS domain-containing hybrid sensor histidine kinase/response regulator [Defluviimonas sp. WL0075]|nr:PAS domain-containing hybrid sensor histidine kinase/response regulator [Defluviimonas sp. WL0075]